MPIKYVSSVVLRSFVLSSILKLGESMFHRIGHWTRGCKRSEYIYALFTAGFAVFSAGFSLYHGRPGRFPKKSWCSFSFAVSGHNNHM